MEEELGVPIFDRLHSGVRLSIAGEMLVHHIRNQLADMQRLKSQIADLSGVRRGHVTVLCGQAMVEYFMPEMITRYREQHPGVTFEVKVCNRFSIRQSLIDYSADIAMVFEPEPFQEFYQVIDASQAVHVMLDKSHPLANNATVRLSDCTMYPMALPSRSNGVRHLIEQSAIRLNQSLSIAVESDNHTLLARCLQDGQTLSFQIPIYSGSATRISDIAMIPVDTRDVSCGRLLVGHLKGRTLPVAAACFLEQLRAELAERFG